MARKRKTLPKDFDEMLTSAPIDQLIAVFDTRELHAYGDPQKSTALGYLDCPDELIVWLVEQGLDVDSRNELGRTGLAERACSDQAEYVDQIPLFLSLGADIESRDNSGRTPFQNAVFLIRPYAAGVLVEHGAAVSGDGWNPGTLLEAFLGQVTNVDIPDAVDMARLLIELGAPITDAARAQVERIGEGFERFRDAFAEDRLAETDSSLNELYAMFEAQPAVSIVKHDGTSPIVVAPGSWQQQHNALWDFLVPGSGPAATEQGEVIRFTGRIADEMYRNGGMNWGPFYQEMVDGTVRILGSRIALSPDEVAEARALAAGVRTGRGSADAIDRLNELAVAWVERNPEVYPMTDEAV